MPSRRTLVTTVVALLALVAGVGVVDGSTTASAAQADGTNVTTFVAPGGALDALQTGTATDTLTRRQRVTPADTLVVRVSAPGLSGAVADQPGNTTTERFRELLSSADASLTAVEIASGEDGPPRVVDLTPDQLVVRRAGENTFDLIYDTGELRATTDRNGNRLADESGGTPLVPVTVFRIGFSFEGTTAETSFGVFPVSVAFSTPGSDGVTLYPLPDQRLVGQTPLAPGTPLVVSVETAGGAVDIERAVTVGGRRQSFANLTLDLLDAPGGVPVTVTARFDGRVIRETRGRIAELTASFTAESTDAPRERLRLRNVSFATGGFIVVRNGEGGPLVANRYVEAGQHDSLTIQYRRAVTADSVSVTAYVDVDGDRILERDSPDFPFRRGGDPVSAVLPVTELTSTTPTDRPTPEPTTVATAAPRPPGTPTPASSSPTGTGPTTPYAVTDASGAGFGPGTALAALVFACVALARNRSVR